MMVAAPASITSTSTTVAEEARSTLPATGADRGNLVVLALALVAAGVALVLRAGRVVKGA